MNLSSFSLASRFSFASRCVALVSLLAGASARAEIPRILPPKQDTLQAVLERIHTHASNDAWKQGGFQDEAIEKWLDKLVGSIAKGANLPELKLPVRQADVVAVDPLQRITAPGALIIGKDVKLGMTFLKNALVLADGKVFLENAQDCVIVARGVVTVRHSRGCVIVSGVHISVPMFDGVPNDTKGGSLLVSRGRVEVKMAYGTRIVSPSGFDQTPGLLQRNIVLINTPTKPLEPAMAALVARNGAPPEVVKIPNLPLELLPEYGVSNKITLLGAVHAQRQIQMGFGPVVRNRTEMGAVGAVIGFQGKRYVADLDQPIVDEAGEVVAGLREWVLTFVDDKTGIFSSKDADAIVRAEER